MPLSVRRFCTSIVLIFTAFICLAGAQTSGEVMRERISKAKAYIAVRNYNAAIYELEGIRRETSDQSVNAVTNVLLMNSYLEMGDYKRAQDFLAEFYKSYKSNSANGNFYYSAIAAQVVKGARNQVERYRNLGLTVSDRNLPLEAVNDIERMRETLEIVITQAKDLSTDKTKAPAAMALLEEATTSRSIIARDDYDAKRWRDAVADSREQMANSNSVVINAVDGTSVAMAQPPQQAVASNTSAAAPPVEVPAVFKPIGETNVSAAAASTPQPRPNENLVALLEKPAVPVDEKRDVERVPQRKPTPTLEIKQEPVVIAPESSASVSGPMDVGSLIAYATKQAAPTYPPAAKSMRTTGVVKVEVTVDENGDVTEVQKASGPSLLQTAAKDAIRRWKFKPFVRAGQPVKAVGFVNFNFSL
jgi:protein TonB